MASVGIRELRANLSRWLERARKGEEVVITDRGRPVARLTSPTGETTLDRLIAEGLVTPAKRKKTPIDRRTLVRVKGKGRISDFVIEQRR